MTETAERGVRRVVFRIRDHGSVGILKGPCKGRTLSDFGATSLRARFPATGRPARTREFRAKKTETTEGRRLTVIAHAFHRQ